MVMGMSIGTIIEIHTRLNSRGLLKLIVDKIYELKKEMDVNAEIRYATFRTMKEMDEYVSREGKFITRRWKYYVIIEIYQYGGEYLGMAIIGTDDKDFIDAIEDITNVKIEYGWECAT